MKRSMMQAYVKRSNEAVALYQRAFGASLISSFLNKDGTFFHAELDIQGHILAVSEFNSVYAAAGEETTPGNTMQFCFHYGEGNEHMIERAYAELKTDATIITPLAPCEYSPLMVDLIDQYGIRWCLFV